MLHSESSSKSSNQPSVLNVAVIDSNVSSKANSTLVRVDACFSLSTVGIDCVLGIRTSLRETEFD